MLFTISTNAENSTLMAVTFFQQCLPCEVTIAGIGNIYMTDCETTYNFFLGMILEAQKLTGENLKVVWAEFSTLS